VEGAVFVGSHLPVSQGDQGVFDGFFGLGVDDLAGIGVGPGGERLPGLALNDFAAVGFGLAFDGFLALAFNDLAAVGWSCAFEGFLGLAADDFGVIGQGRVGKEQGSGQDAHVRPEWLYHAYLFKLQTSHRIDPPGAPGRSISNC
jgi:hypothetical protein